MRGFQSDWLNITQGMQKEMERLLDYLGSSKPPTVYFGQMWEPAVDIYETATEVVVVAELAGVNQNDIEIVVDNNSLIIRGQRKELATRGRRNYYQMEIHAGPFERRVLLPARIDPDRTKASHENGMLEIVLAKARPEQVIHVSVKNLDQF
ncbi:MAG: Hsp20/alpha crystallin family protein [Chloroflexi bacterium]|nr:Hsp20/alpha crystallin family protein [Chloroflexota bacterium]